MRGATQFMYASWSSLPTDLKLSDNNRIVSTLENIFAIELRGMLAKRSSLFNLEQYFRDYKGSLIARGLHIILLSYLLLNILHRKA